MENNILHKRPKCLPNIFESYQLGEDLLFKDFYNLFSKQFPFPIIVDDDELKLVDYHLRIYWHLEKLNSLQNQYPDIRSLRELLEVTPDLFPFPIIIKDDDISIEEYWWKMDLHQHWVSLMCWGSMQDFWETKVFPQRRRTR